MNFQLVMDGNATFWYEIKCFWKRRVSTIHFRQKVIFDIFDFLYYFGLYLPFCDRQHGTFLYGRTHIISHFFRYSQRWRTSNDCFSAFSNLDRPMKYFDCSLLYTDHIKSCLQTLRVESNWQFWCRHHAICVNPPHSMGEKKFF